MSEQDRVTNVEVGDKCTGESQVRVNPCAVSARDIRRSRLRLGDVVKESANNFARNV